MSLPLHITESSTGTEERLFTCLKEHLYSNGSIPATTTAQRINHEKSVLSITDPGAFCQDTWSVVRQLVDQIPPDHGYQDRLVEVIEALTKLPATEVRVWGETKRLWADLPLLGADMREDWNPPEYKPKDAKAWPEDAQKWLNLNAFAARMLNLEYVTWDNFGLWVMRDILEKSEVTGPELENGLDAVAIWIKYAGQVMYMTSNSHQQEERMFKPGPLYKGPAKYCLERWNFWKDRLGELGGWETRRRMEEIEKMVG